MYRGLEFAVQSAIGYHLWPGQENSASNTPKGHVARGTKFPCVTCSKIFLIDETRLLGRRFIAHVLRRTRRIRVSEFLPYARTRDAGIVFIFQSRETSSRNTTPCLYPQTRNWHTLHDKSRYYASTYSFRLVCFSILPAFADITRDRKKISLPSRLIKAGMLLEKSVLKGLDRFPDLPLETRYTSKLF